MVRTVEHWAGLAALGSAALGPLVVPTPFVLTPEGWTDPSDASPLTYGPRANAPSGRRRYAVQRSGTGLEFEFPIPTPELRAPDPSEVSRDGPVAVVQGPIDAHALEGLTTDPVDLVVLSNARRLFAEGRPFVEAVRTLRRALGPRPLLWAPRVAVPHRVPFLLYAGVDLFDPVEPAAWALEARPWDPELGPLPPPSPAAGSAPAVTEGEAHRRAAAAVSSEVGRAERAARAGRLRELVEGRLPTEPVLGELLRYADRELGDLLEELAPVTGRASHAYVLRESFRRPEVRRFRTRFLERYRPPPSKRVLVVVPCSRTKPYRNSRSHRRFAEAWASLEGPERLHVVSITSPLGVVPRDLEDLPPARHYDIAVTGDWDEDERTAVLDGLRHLATTGSYAAAVVHLDPVEYAFVRAGWPERLPAVWTLDGDRTTTAEAIDRLRRALAEALAPLPPSGGVLRTVREELRALAAVQFGPAVAARLLADPLRLHGRPWFQRLSDGQGTDLATWREERGLFQLTVAGGERIGLDQGLTVEVAAGVALAGDLFDPGVARADAGIRVGDAVVLGKAGTVHAVGEAALPGPVLGRLGRGLAVRVRHRRGAAVPSDTDIPAPRDGDAGRSSSG